MGFSVVVATYVTIITFTIASSYSIRISRSTEYVREIGGGEGLVILARKFRHVGIVACAVSPRRAVTKGRSHVMQYESWQIHESLQHH